MKLQVWATYGFCFVVLGLEPGALQVPGKCLTSELHPQPFLVNCVVVFLRQGLNCVALAILELCLPLSLPVLGFKAGTIIPALRGFLFLSLAWDNPLASTFH